MNNNQQRYTINASAVVDPNLDRLTAGMLKLADGRDLVPLGTRETSKGEVLVVGVAPASGAPHVSLDKDSRFACVLLLRQGTEAEWERWGPGSARPEYIDLLQFDPTTNAFVFTGQSQGYIGD